MIDYHDLEQLLSEALGLRPAARGGSRSGMRRPRRGRFADRSLPAAASASGRGAGQAFYTVPSDHYNCAIGSPYALDSSPGRRARSSSRPCRS